MKERLRSIRYGLGDVGHAIVAPFRKLSVVARRRLVALLVLIAAIVLIVTVAVPALPCSFPGGETCAPEDEAIALVPDDALAYVHANLDAETDEYADFSELAEELPLFSGQIAERAASLLVMFGDASRVRLRRRHPSVVRRRGRGGDACGAVRPGARSS